MAELDLHQTERLANDPKAVDELNQRVISEFRANQGKVGGLFEGFPVLLMTMKGAKTGRTLVRPVCYGRDGDAIVIFASYGGAPRNPPWYHNLVANPEITVEVERRSSRRRLPPLWVRNGSAYSMRWCGNFLS
jgi:deazaflavin-dependent oxidoreductase (nitroreductase family)